MLLAQEQTSGVDDLLCRSGQSNDLPATIGDSAKDVESGQQDSNSTPGGEGFAGPLGRSKPSWKLAPRFGAGKGLSDVAKGQLCLMCVAALWGSYGPAIRCVLLAQMPAPAPICRSRLDEARMSPLTS